ncbi:hypothetical protein [Glutamicibacter ardleyensis]|uniref:hypothetical protein n=1 Tax=Glutamicibacter ardleyensis TaxID=225894 RepID=UPI003FD624E9
MHASAVDISARTQGDRVEALLALAYELEDDNSDQRIRADASRFFTDRGLKLSSSTWWRVRSVKYLVSSYAFLVVLAEFLDVEPPVIAREVTKLPDDMSAGLAMLRSSRVNKIVQFAEEQLGNLDDSAVAGLRKALS